MAASHSVDNFISLAAAYGLLEAEEAMLLLEIKEDTNVIVPYWNYPAFDFDAVTDGGSWVDFRFKKADIPRVIIALHLPTTITTYNGLVVDIKEAICLLLRRFSYPNRLPDLVKQFGQRHTAELSIIISHMVNFLFDNYFEKLLCSLDQGWLSPANLKRFAKAVHDKGGALDNCWGFIDGTIRPISRPKENQRVVYNGHKRVHCLKYQAIATPNGLIANLYGPVEGSRHDAFLFSDSKILDKLSQHSFGQYNKEVAYGDTVCPLRNSLITG